MLCIYHIADHDGKGSGAVVKSVIPCKLYHRDAPIQIGRAHV